MRKTFMSYFCNVIGIGLLVLAWHIIVILMEVALPTPLATDEVFWEHVKD